MKMVIAYIRHEAFEPIRADLLDTGATDWTSVLDTLDASSSTVKGQVRLSNISDQTKWMTFDLAAVTTPSGYRNFMVGNKKLAFYWIIFCRNLLA